MFALAAPARRTTVRETTRGRYERWLAFVAVAVIGGSVAFVLFFEGLARAAGDSRILR